MPETSQTSPVLSLPYIQPSQAQKHVTHNTALAALDALVQPVVADRDRTDPPAPVTAGAAHLVASGGQGAWAGQDQAIAVHDGVAWAFYAPKPGWRVHVLAEGFDVVRDHPALIEAVMHRLAPRGQLVFSTNARRFELDEAIGRELTVEDLTRRTLAPDFRREPPAHRCWRIVRPE